MVASTITATTQQKGVAANGTAVVNQNVTLKTLPKGKYTLVGIDIDTTGRRLIDEVSICRKQAMLISLFVLSIHILF